MAGGGVLHQLTQPTQTINQRTNMKDPLLAVLIVVIVILAIWDGVWKLIALWKSARHNQLAWFICLAIFNTAGILPILYILCFQKTDLPAPALPPKIT
jgi:hypothetical protein